VTAWDPRATIAAKRERQTLPPEEVERFVLAYAADEIGDGPAAAFLMAALLNGLDAAETLAMTRAMIASGDTVTFGDVGRPTVDKHSTGGVADGVTLVFAPLAAALGLAVAKLSGRGLGHTGGTLDKLESIPGLRTDLEPDRIARQVQDVGCAVAAQSARLVPADGALDATATVPSVPLIAASVMSKKLAVTSDLIVLDVKAGSGAFMKEPARARDLAQACLVLARGAGRPCGIAITDMSQPLGEAIGNALDVIEAVEILRGARRGLLRDLSIWLAARALEAARGMPFDEASARAATALDDGSASERFARMVEAQGGDPRVTEDPASVLPRASVIEPLLADRTGVLGAVDAEAIGMASRALGAGRVRKGEEVDPAVGIVFRPKIGDRIDTGEPLGEIHARSQDAAEEASRRTLEALTVGEAPVEPPPLIHGWFPPEGGR